VVSSGEGEAVGDAISGLGVGDGVVNSGEAVGVGVSRAMVGVGAAGASVGFGVAIGVGVAAGEPGEIRGVADTAGSLEK
jgi:hypothetical protein